MQVYSKHNKAKNSKRRGMSIKSGQNMIKLRKLVIIFGDKRYV